METNLSKKTGRPAIHGFRRRNTQRTKEYYSWQCMKQRCHNPNSEKFKWYGMLGIRVCKRWKDSFENFLNDVGYAPSDIHTLDRINPFGHYQPGNVRWATPKEQANNRRANYIMSA